MAAADASVHITVCRVPPGFRGMPPAEAAYQPHNLAAKVAALQMMVFAVVRGPGDGTSSCFDGYLSATPVE